jgi:hypothetical protein
MGLLAQQQMALSARISMAQADMKKAGAWPA